jgi:glycosyltransferase involved in cell wall biosynthesis
MSGVDKIEFPLVSVIINCYNGELFIKEAIDSVFQQSYKNWEIIFWDNCSIDNSSIIAKSYGHKLKYYKSEFNTTLGEARNLAIQKTNGKYICFIDTDDIWSNPNKLTLQVKMMESNKDLALCYGSIQEVYKDGSFFRNVITNLHSGFIFDKLLLQFDISIITSMLRKSILLDSSLNFDNNIKASEEFCLFMQLGSKYKIGVSREIMAKYRVHQTSLTSQSLSILGKERRYTLDLIFKSSPILYFKYKKQFKEAYARADYYDARWHMSNGEKKKAIKLLIKNIRVNYKYLLLLIVSIFPIYFWNKIHLLKRNRF